MISIVPIAPKPIFLTRGQIAWIDAEDYERVSQFKWQADWSESTYSFYASRRSRIQMSRFILKIIDPSVEVDHRDHNTLNNQKSNLRISTGQQNKCNKRKHRDNKSGYKGVVYCSGSKFKKNPWKAQIGMLGKVIYLGMFNTAELAYEAYKAAALEYHGEFACFE